MSGSLLVLLVLSATPSGASDTSYAEPSLQPATSNVDVPENAAQWERAVQRALADHARAVRAPASARGAVSAAVARLLELKRLLASDRTIAPAERHRLDVKLQRRLIQVPANILAQFGVAPPAQQQPDQRGNAAGLADLIQSTIEPESWDVNGGPGHISGFGP